ncbi:hypothetical protein BDZ89DRAFT_908753, partial [Hymenopellis radicata]
TLTDITDGKAILLKHPHGDARDFDSVSYARVIAMSNESLLALLNECLSRCDEYRGIGLQSCLLRFASIVFNAKLTRAVDEANILPPSQNGFHPTYRTNNNIFILRTLIKQARAHGKTLYVAFVDISNAFASMNHASLWLKL